MTFWCGSGSADPCLWVMDPDPDPALFIIDLQDANKKLLFFKSFLHITFWRYIYIVFKKIKRSQNSRNQGFSYYSCLIIEGSGSGSRAGSIPLTNGSGSRRTNNMWIRWIWIRNTVFNAIFIFSLSYNLFLSNFVPCLSSDMFPGHFCCKSVFWPVSGLFCS